MRKSTASFTVPFDPHSVTRQQPDLTIKLPDPPRSSSDPIIRQGIARYAGATITLLHVTSNAPFDLSSPVTGAVRKVNLDPSSPPLPGGITQMLEISPLPFTIAPVLRLIKPGLPTFYMAHSYLIGPIDDDSILRPDSPLVSSAGDAYIGVLFQDRTNLAPWSWIDIIQQAMQSSDEAQPATDWSGLATLYSNVQSLRILNHVGAPYNGSQIFQIRIHKTDDSFEGPWFRKTGSDGDLEQTVIANPLPRANGPQASLFGSAGEQTELKWNGDGPTGDISLPVQCLYENALSKSPGESILLPADIKRGHLQLLELACWFAPRTNGITLKRYHVDSRVEPIVDGIPSFKRLVDDLMAISGQGNGAHFAGWAFKNFPLDLGRKDESGSPIDTTLIALSKRIISSGGGVRFLMSKFINLKADPGSDVDKAANLAILVLIDALILFSALGAFSTDSAGFLVVFAGFVLLQVVLGKWTVSDLIDKIIDKIEQSTDVFKLLNEVPNNNIAIWSQYPMRLLDNPAAILPLPSTLPNVDTYIDQFGSWHQKIQLIKRIADANGNQFIAYLGGIDINTDRLDTPGHQITSPFHDVHARITGPASADVFQTWEERYKYEQQSVSGLPDPVFSPPRLESLLAQSTKHITQISRTYFKPADGSNPFTFAPSGDRGINDTLIKAIKAAREYIYIEDQYFTPNDSQPEDSADTYFDALVDAASKCQRLIIVVPSETDQPFGDLRRKFLFKRLQDSWSNRILIGTPLRRPILPNPGRLASEGRCILMNDVTTTSGTIIIGPQARVPLTVPFWLWIDGELMLSSGQPQPTHIVDNIPCMKVDVLRGQSQTNPGWGAKERNHKKGAAVTLAQLRGIYVHAKVMMIDDIFVSIGSANINRRGLLNDGEINIFTVPEQLKAASDNPALRLRTALWAEHLGITPSMGQALLHDPIAGFDLFLRSHYEGNRFTPFDALYLKPYLNMPIGDSLMRLLLSAAGIKWVDSLISTIWNDFSDPTSFNDPQPGEGPTPH